MPAKQKIAIIGGGLSALITAQNLADRYDIDLFEKARGVGGRMSTRRADPYQFDHGAQYFTARTKPFKAFLKPHIESGLIQEWTPQVLTLEKGEKPYKRDWFEPHYVAAPHMNSLCKALAAAMDINIHLQTHITALEKSGDGTWMLQDLTNESYGPYDAVIITTPSHQAVDLLPANFLNLPLIKDVKMTGCHSIMIGFDTPPTLNWGAAVVKNSPIEWMAVNSQKPDRTSDFSILITTRNDWSETHIEDEIEAVQSIIINEFQDLTNISADKISHISTHRWRYANTLQHADKDKDNNNEDTHHNYFIDRDQKIGVCGDWCIKGHVESAFTSAYQLSQDILKNGL